MGYKDQKTRRHGESEVWRVRVREGDGLWVNLVHVCVSECCVCICVQDILGSEWNVFVSHSRPKISGASTFYGQCSIMDFSGNRITSLVGLESCLELLELSISENRITRIGECGAIMHTQKVVCTFCMPSMQ